MNSLLFTGFPGFIGRRLIKALVEKFDYQDVFLIVEPSRVNQAREEISSYPDSSRYHIIMGDITQKKLGVDPETIEKLRGRVKHAFHLAAIYDLTVPWERAYRVNVIGTENFVNFLAEIGGVERFVYFSTAYVSGTLEGTVFEDELATPPGFKNHYEHTKYLAEQIVRRNMSDIPTTIIRPAIVIGDSRTGETDKFDGPYYVMIFFKRYPRWLPLPYIGKGEAEVNLIPVNFIIDATVALTGLSKAVGKTYHLADPSPMTARQLYELFCLKLRNSRPRGYVPLSIVRAILSIRPIARFWGVPPEALDYFDHKVHYDTKNTESDLVPLGIKVPRLTEYIDNIVRFFEQHYRDKRFRVF